MRKAERLRQHVLRMRELAGLQAPSEDVAGGAPSSGPMATRFPEQDARGLDLSLIREDLKLTPVERIRRGERGRQQALRLLEIGRKQIERADGDGH